MVNIDPHEFNKKIAKLSPEKRRLLALRLEEKGLSLPVGDHIYPRLDDEPSPLSFSQRRLWFLHQLHPDMIAFNLPMALRFTGKLEPNLLRKSINAIVYRHEVLRTTYIEKDGIPLQIVHPPAEVELEYFDLTHIREAEREPEAKQLMLNEVRQPFDLSSDVMFKPFLYRLSPQDHILFLLRHHIASDGWSTRIVQRELLEGYLAAQEYRSANLPQLEVQYADFALWQRARFHEQGFEQELNYWRNQLNGLPQLELPIDRPRPSVVSYKGSQLILRISRSLTAKLRNFSRQERVTMNTTMLTAFSVLLHRYSGQVDFAIGVPVSGRIRRELEPLIGFFINTLVLRSDFSGNPTFVDLLHQINQSSIDAFDHQNLPFEMLVEELQHERHLNRSPLIQTTFQYLDIPIQPSIKIPGMLIERLPIDPGTSQFDFSISITESAEGLIGRARFNSDTFETKTIQRMIEHYQVILDAISVNPSSHVSSLSLLSDRERNQILVDWNTTAVDFPKNKFVHQLFEDQVHRTPDATAVYFGGETLTYQELNQSANQLAYYLRQLGVAPEVLVGICMERSLEMIVGILGILKAGGAFVPINPHNPKERVAFMINDIQTPIVLIQKKLEIRLPISNARVICLDSDWEEISQELVENPDVNISSNNAAYVIYTSGSTGTPKGTLIEHRSLVNHIHWVNDFLTGTAIDYLPFVTNFSFDGSLKQIFSPLLKGKAIWILSEEVVQEPAKLIRELLSRSRVGLYCVPSLWKAILEELDTRDVIDSLHNLSSVYLGGESLSEQVVNKSLSLLPHLKLWNLYGPTEASITTTAIRLSSHEKMTIGKPLPNYRVYILDSNLQPVPIGVFGELHISGIGLARGYLNQPSLTAEKFIPNPFSELPGDRLYKTGDLVRYHPNGNIEYRGRIDHQVKIRGYRIELGEIEAVLSQFPGVKQSVAVVKEFKPDDRRIIAYIQQDKESQHTSQKLREFLKTKLPEYMIPSTFILMDSLPMTPHGKLDRAALPDPEHYRLERDTEIIKPRSVVEKQLTEIWEDVLGVGEIGIYDNFFELGGHSLLATQVTSRAQQKFKVDLPLRYLFEAPNIAGLAERIEMVQGINQIQDHHHDSTDAREQGEV